jgi:hypothetical protein
MLIQNVWDRTFELAWVYIMYYSKEKNSQGFKLEYLCLIKT